MTEAHTTRTWALALAALLATAAFAGCLGGDDDGPPEPPEEPNEPSEPSEPDPPDNGTDEQNQTQPPEPPAPPEPEPFDMTGTGCRELIVQVPTTTQAARAFVPENYTLVEAGDHAVAFGGLKICDDLQIDGSSVGPASTSDVGVLIEAPDDSDDLHYYQAWWITDNPELWQRLVGLGWLAFLVENTTMTDDRVEGIAGSVSVHVPWALGEYSVETTGAGTPAFPDSRVIGWHETLGGTMTVDKSFVFSNEGNPPATMTAAEGSPMAQLIGGAEANGVAFLMSYGMEGRVDYVE